LANIEKKSITNTIPTARYVNADRKIRFLPCNKVIMLLIAIKNEIDFKILAKTKTKVRLAIKFTTNLDI
jgi:hypothetical protein